MIGIYKITNNITKKCYIGQSGRIENRFAGHKKAVFNKNNKQYEDELYQDMRTYGIENFSFEILETVSLLELEEKWIQKEVSKGTAMYNKTLNPFTEPTATRLFNKEQIQKIIKDLKENKLSNIKIAKKYGCSSSVIDNINNGVNYKQDDIQYPIRVYRVEGEKNTNALYTDEEVMKIRKEYVNKSCKELFELYSKNKSLKAFERIISGRSYSHLPYYIKREKKWVQDNMQYRLEP